MQFTPRSAYYLVTSLNWFGAVLPMAVMVLLAQERGISLAEVGLFIGLYSIVVAVLELPSGALADAMGRKRAYLLGGALNVVARLVFLFAFDLTAFVAYAVVSGAARAMSSGALEAWLIDALQAEDADADLQPVLATAGSYQLAGLALGTVAGGSLPLLFASLPSAGVLTPLAVPLLASIVVQLAVLALTALIVVERRGEARAASPSPSATAGPSAILTMVKSALATATRSPILRLLLLADVLVGGALAASENLWQPFFAALLPGSDAAELAAGGGTLALGVILGGSFAVGIAGNALATRVTRATGKRYALVAAGFQLAQGAAFVGLALSGRFLLAAGLLWVTYLTRSGWTSPHATLYNREVTADRRSAMLSLQSLAGFFGGFIGSIALGALAETVSIGAAWVVAGAAVAASSLLYLKLDRIDLSDRARVDAAGPAATATSNL